MIIDTNKIEIKELKKIARLISESNMLPDENGVYNALSDDSMCTIYYYDVITNGKCNLKFGKGGNFTLYGESRDYMDKNRRRLDSLKNFPESCNEFSLDNYKIKEIDYLPKAKKYEFFNCPIKKIKYSFPNTIDSLSMTNAFIKTLENFPLKINDSLYLKNVRVSDFNNIPEVNESLVIHNCSNIKEINTKGNFQKLEIDSLNNLESLNISSNNLKLLKINNCSKLKNIKGLSKINKNCKIIIEKSPNIDPYILNEVKACIKYKGSLTDIFMLYYIVFYDYDIHRITDPSLFTPEEFEWQVLKYWTNNPKTINNAISLNLKFESNIKKREEIIRCNNVIDKFNL